MLFRSINCNFSFRASSSSGQPRACSIVCTRTALPPTLRSTTDTVIRRDSGLPNKKEEVPDSPRKSQARAAWLMTLKNSESPALATFEGGTADRHGLVPLRARVEARDEPFPVPLRHCQRMTGGGAEH